MAVTVFTESVHPGAFIHSEMPSTGSRDEVLLDASQTIVVGMVLGKLTATSLWGVITPASSDGKQLAAAIAIYPATTAAGETTRRIAVISRNAEVNVADLTFSAGITTPQRTLAISQLTALGISCRS